MLFNSYAFALFFVAVFAGYWLLRRTDRARVLLLLAASYFFYGYWSWKFLGLILFSTLLDYAVGRGLERAEQSRVRRALLVASLVGNLGCLGFFKYWDFFATEAADLLAALGLAANPAVLGIALPVGISFYTFQTLSYTIDVYRRQIDVERDFARFALFVAFFPQLVAGPIVRAKHFLPQIARAPLLTASAFESGLALMAWGLVKKVVFADVLGRGLVDPFWADPASFGAGWSLLAVYGYAFQIYGDFSGYSDMAIGAARLLGFDLGRNFDAPYCATSPRDFWHRWHISLSTWLRDYLYLPLGGSRGTRVRTQVNLMATMLLGGLWHGASWMFVAWGGFHGALLAVDRAIGAAAPTTRGALWSRRLVTFHLVCVGWVLFRSGTPQDARAVFAALVAAPATPAVSVWALVALALAAGTHVVTPSGKQRARRAFARAPAVARGAAYAVLVGLVLNAVGSTPFLYFQF